MLNTCLFWDNATSLTGWQATAALLMWIKLFYFMRLSEATGHFITMIARVFTETKVFFQLYLALVLSFSTSLFILNDKAPKGYAEVFFGTYMIGMGEYDVDFDSASTAPLIMGFIFFAFTIAINIVMLNVLIALVSKAYEDVTGDAEMANYFERVNLIRENRMLVSKSASQGICAENEYLAMVYLL